MKYLIYSLLLVCIALSGCLPYKQNPLKSVQSEKREVHPEISKYQEEKRKKNEASKVAKKPIREKKESSTEEVILPESSVPQEEIKKNSPSWWLWD